MSTLPAKQQNVGAGRRFVTISLLFRAILFHELINLPPAYPKSPRMCRRSSELALSKLKCFAARKTNYYLFWTLQIYLESDWHLRSYERITSDTLSY